MTRKTAGNACRLLLAVNQINQPSAIAPVGHVAAQAPQDTQTSASMLYCESPWEIAPTGHPSAQEPQETQASEITYAIGFSSFELMTGLFHLKALLAKRNLKMLTENTYFSMLICS
jgi:hypothetical protein